MTKILKKLPLPISGLILGLAVLGNLLQTHGEVFRTILGTTAGIMLVLFIAKILIFPQQTKKDLDNPLIASVFPTFSMAVMLLSTYLKPESPALAAAVWFSGLALHLLLIIWFTIKYVLKFKLAQFFPSWFIVYVGLAVASVTASGYNMAIIGQFAFWFALAAYPVLLLLTFKRIIIVKQMPEQAMPTLAILAAPASLLLTGYLRAFTEKNILLVYLLIAFSLVFYAAVITMLPKLLSSKFYPSFAAFTFPLIISGAAMRQANTFLINANQVIPLLEYLVYFKEFLAVIITLYVFMKYVLFLAAPTPSQS
ncbi:MAG: TDT family transporter [Clostridium sp.]|nr:TDT family transporter [Clostridium sp.]